MHAIGGGKKRLRVHAAQALRQRERLRVASVVSSEDAAHALAATPPGPTRLSIGMRRGHDVERRHLAPDDPAEVKGPRNQMRLENKLASLASPALGYARLLEELDHANRLRSDFVAVMSHELRTPLNHILGYTELMLEKGCGPLAAEQVEMLQKVERSGRRLLELANLMLDLTRLDTGMLPLNLAPTSLATLLAEIDADGLEPWDPSRLRFIWKVPPGLPHIETDPIKLKIVVTNLIGNALKFTPAGSVTVAAGARGEGVEIAVTDTGIGIDNDALPIIFEPFRQGDSSSTRRFCGVGLGLYIVRRLLDLLGGTIEVESQVGLGSTFRVWVPRTLASRQG